MQQIFQQFFDNRAELLLNALGINTLTKRIYPVGNGK